MPVRKTHRGHGGLTGYLAGSRGQHGVSFESLLEKDLFNLLRYQQKITREVWSYEERPLQISYLDAEGETHTYIPDSLVYYRSDRLPELIEVKYHAALLALRRELMPKFQAAKALCAERGWRFRVMTERSIHIPLLEHARFFPSYLDRQHDPDDLRSVLDEFRRQGKTTVGAVLDRLAPDLTPAGRIARLDDSTMRRAQLLGVIWTLVALGFILIDLQTPPTHSSAVHLWEF